MLSIISKKKSRKIDKDKEILNILEEIQKSAINLTVDTSELISIMKRKDKKYKEEIEKIENSK